MLVIDAVAVEAIAAAVDEQYLDELREEYVGYRNATIKTMLDRLRAWFVITNAEKIAIKATFLAPWADTPDAHITTFARQLDRRQTECDDHGVTITDKKKSSTSLRRCTPAAFSKPDSSTIGKN